MPGEEVPTGWVIGGVAAIIAGMAAAVRWLAASKDAQYGDRIAALEAVVSRGDAKLESLNEYIRSELSGHLVEAHARERRLAAIIAKYGDPEPSDQRNVKTEAIEKDKK